MVQDYVSPVRVTKKPFEMVMAAYNKRFPRCDLIPVFLGCDVINEYESPDKSIHMIERRCRLNVDAPRLLKRVVGVDHILFVQKNVLNRRDRTLTISAYNESFASRVIVHETCEYKVHPDNPEWTAFTQSAKMEVKSFFGFESTVEKIAIKQYSASIQTGKQIIELHLKELIEVDGITSIPTWAEENPELASMPPSSDAETDSDKTIENETTRVPSTSGSSRSIDQDRVVGGSSDNLEQEYIVNNLGLLHPLQESKLIQLRKRLSDTHMGKIPNDSHILRFLRSQDFNLEKSKEVLCQSLSWRKQHQVDKILSTYTPPQLLKDYYLGCWHHVDLEQRPIYVLRLGQMDTKGLLKACGEEQILRHVLNLMEEGLQKCKEATKREGTPLNSWTCLVDLEGMSMRHLWRPGVQALLRIMEVMEKNYPETMAQLLIVRAPRVFPVLWTLISPFIEEKTRSKFMMYTGTDYMGPGGLIDYMAEDYIPDFLGGNCKCDLPEGGPVPKSLYRTEWDKGDDLGIFEDALYKQANVFRGLPHEVVVEVPEKDCVITWDFDAIRGDVMYTLYHSEKCVGPIDVADVNCMLPGPSALPSPGATSTCQNTQVISKSMQLDEDYTLIENGILCKEGESVQGSHVCRKAGYYILQWRLNATSPADSSFITDVLYDVTHHPKAKLIYYHELLPSNNFRGSMTSLESCQSAFSSLSQVTSSSITSALP